MADRPGAIPLAEMERRLVELDPAEVFPATPDLVSAVFPRLGSGAPRRAIRLRTSTVRRRIVVLIAAALLLLAAIAAAAKLSIGGISIRQGTPPSPGATAPETGALGVPVTMARVNDALGAPLEPPSTLGSPDAAYLDRLTGGQVRATLAWRPRPWLPRIDGLPWGAILTAFRGDPAIAAKTLSSEKSEIAAATVSGARAIWVTGPHELDVTTSRGAVRYRVSGNVLLWARGDLTLRLETAHSKSEAVRIAASIPG